MTRTEMMSVKGRITWKGIMTKTDMRTMTGMKTREKIEMPLFSCHS